MISAVMLSLLGTVLLSQPEVALANSSVVVMSKWNSAQQCNVFPYGACDVDTYARDDLDAMFDFQFVEIRVGELRFDGQLHFGFGEYLCHTHR